MVCGESKFFYAVFIIVTDFLCILPEVSVHSDLCTFLVHMQAHCTQLPFTYFLRIFCFGDCSKCIVREKDPLFLYLLVGHRQVYTRSFLASDVAFPSPLYALEYIFGRV